MQLTRRTLLASGLAATVAPLHAATPAAPSFLLRNVLLETGYDREDGDVVRTRTAKSDIFIRDGLISSILPAGLRPPAGLRAVDGRGLLLLPSLRDMHIHIDKTDYPGPWRAPRKRRNGITGQIALEQKMLPLGLPQVERRAAALVELMQANGTTFARVQCNVDPVQGTRHVELLSHMFAQKAATFGHELVAFPQHGILANDLVPVMRRVLAAGATHIGGIDPTAIEHDMPRAIDAILGLAIETGKPVDIHLHEPGESGVAAIRLVCDRAEREPVLQGKISFSHCFALMSLPPAELDALAARMAALGMTVNSTLPMGGRVMPVPALLAKGVAVRTGTDSIYSYWSVFGTADTLGKANLACQLYGWGDEAAIAQSLALSTGGITPLDAAGAQVWPKPGDAADMMLVPASCSAETVARQPARTAVFHRGALAAGAI